MSIAVLIESQQDAGIYQTLVVPVTNDVLIFNRIYTGLRGRASRWSQGDVSMLSPEMNVTSEPVGIILNEIDVMNAKMGSVTAISTKLLAQNRITIEDGAPYPEVVAGIVERLFSGDQKLNSLTRENKVVTLAPIASAELEPVGFFPAVAPVEQVQPKEPVTIPTVVELPKPVTTQVELAQIPDKMWGEKYLNRKVAGGKTDYEVLDVAMKYHQNVLIRGHAGSGKTMCVLGFASVRGYRYYNVSANVGLEPSHLFGAWTPTEQAGVFKWQDGPVTDLVRHGGVLLLNEIDFMPERITTVLFGLLDDRREIQLLENGGEVIKAHPNLLVVGDHNPNYRGARPMNQAWKDRFAHKLEFEYDKAIERKLIKNKSLLAVAEKLREQAFKGEIDTPISTRGLISFVKNYENLGLDYAITSYLNGFLDDEREAIKLVFDTTKDGIAKDFGITVTVDAESDEA